MCGSDNQHYSKYAYRQEQAIAASFLVALKQSCFCFYQKLVEELDKENKGSGDKRMMYGLMHGGFESTGNIEMSRMNMIMNILKLILAGRWIRLC